MQKTSSFYQNICTQLDRDGEYIFQGKSAGNGANLLGGGADFSLHRVISKHSRTFSALPAPTVPRRRSDGAGVGEDRERGERCWELPSSVFSAPIMRGPSCQDTSTAQPSSSPPASRIFIYLFIFTFCRAKLLLLSLPAASSMGTVPGEVPIGGCGSTVLRDTLIKNNRNKSRHRGLIRHSSTKQSGIYLI